VSKQNGRAATINANRYLQQLPKHSAHNNEVTFGSTSANVSLRGNRVQMHATPEELQVTLTNGPQGEPALLRSAFEEHIDRFAIPDAPPRFIGRAEW
jgi:4-hydroxy-2-oxoheptanedioate aldolase